MHIASYLFFILQSFLFLSLFLRSSPGFASFEYEEDGYEDTHVVRLDFTVNGHLVEELSIMVHNERARALAQFVVFRLKRVIQPQPFKIKIKGQGE